MYLYQCNRYFNQKFGFLWTEEHEDLLIKGIQEFGVGNHAKIKKKYLKNRVYSALYIYIYIYKDSNRVETENIPLIKEI